MATAATVAILYANGYRIDQEEGLELSQKGILVANSDPNGAQVFIDGELKTATNNSINLEPGEHNITIRKEGFLPWEKKITIKEKEVTQVNAFLAPTAPSLSALTFSGAFNPKITKDLTKIAYGVPFDPKNNGNGEVERDGLWVLETGNLPLGFSRDPRRITNGDLSEANWEWSPDGREVLLTAGGGAFLLDAGVFTPQTELINIIPQRDDIKRRWESLSNKKLKARLGTLNDELEDIFLTHGTGISFSADESKFLYTATGSATIPEGLVKGLPGSSTQPEKRDIKAGQKYVYDIKEDRNFLVGDEGSIIMWLPNSLNLLLPEDGKISIIDYDGRNFQTIFSGSFIYPNVFPSSSTGKVLILTNLGAEDGENNLYWLGLR